MSSRKARFADDELYRHGAEGRNPAADRTSVIPGLSAGFSRVEITPAEPVLLAGYAGRNEPHRGVQAPIFVRCLSLRDSADREVAIIQGDLLSFRGAASKVRERLATEIGLSPEYVFLSAVHTHAAPATDRRENAAWVEMLVRRSVEAVETARAERAPASLRIYRGESRVNINRREPNTGEPYSGPERNDNPIRLGTNPDGPVDHELLVAAFEGVGGRRIGTIVSYACHGTGLWDTNYSVSPDWIGNAVSRLESDGGFGTVLYLNGAAGNLDPIVAYQHEFGPLVPVVETFVEDVRRTAAGRNEPASAAGQAGAGRDEPASAAGQAGAPALDAASVTLELPLKVPRNGDDRALVTIRRLSIGPVNLVFFPGELFCETGMAVKRAAAGSTVVVVAYADEGDAGYVPVREAYTQGGYEVWASRFSEDAEDIVRRGLSRVLRTKDSAGRDSVLRPDGSGGRTCPS